MASYGRGNVASRRKAQRGSGRNAYKIAAKTAQEFFGGTELFDYQNAIKTLKSGKSTNSAEYKTARQKVDRLRDLASMRSLSEFEEGAMDFAKPWRRRPEGAISADDRPQAQGGSGVDLGFLGMAHARRITRRIEAAQAGQFDPEFFGNTGTRERVRNQQEYGPTRQMPRIGRRADRGDPRNQRRGHKAYTLDYGTTSVTDAEQAYLGEGGTETLFGLSRGGQNSRRVERY